MIYKRFICACVLCMYFVHSISIVMHATCYPVCLFLYMFIWLMSRDDFLHKQGIRILKQQGYNDVGKK